MAVHRKQYAKEFKEEAVRLITQSGISLAQVSRDLDVNANILRCWKQGVEHHCAQAFPGQGVPVEQELARLRRQNEVRRREREVLKKAITIFSQHKPRSTGASTTTKTSSQSS